MDDLTDASDSKSQSPVATQEDSSSHVPFNPTDIPAAAVREVQHVFIFGGTFFTTVIALLASAFGVVAALAWSRAIFDWLPTIPFLHFDDPLGRDFAYAGVTTLVAVVVVLLLGVANAALKLKTKLPSYPPQQQTTAGAATEREENR